jgi:hypothetical protein
MKSYVKSKVIAATVAIALALGLIVLVKRGDSSTTTVEPADPLSAERESRPLPSRASQDTTLLDPIETAPNAPVATNLYARLINATSRGVSLEQLKVSRAEPRNGGALLGRCGLQAMTRRWRRPEKFPNDPRVQFAAAFKADSPEERRQWLEKFKQSDPDNALADYLLAGELFKSGQTEQALQEVMAAAAKPGMENYLLDFIQNAEEAYVAAGVPGDTAKAIAVTSALLPDQAKLKQVGVDLVELAKRYQQAGDETSAQAVLEMGMNLGRRIEQTPQITLIQELVGMAIERLS